MFGVITPPLNASVMRLSTITVLGSLLVGCATVPSELCLTDVTGSEWILLRRPPATSHELIARFDETPDVIRQHQRLRDAWFSRRGGDLLLCRYNPAARSACGSQLWEFHDAHGEWKLTRTDVITCITSSGA
jgi:hypothetical protein